MIVAGSQGHQEQVALESDDGGAGGGHGFGYGDGAGRFGVVGLGDLAGDGVVDLDCVAVEGVGEAAAGSGQGEVPLCDAGPQRFALGGIAVELLVTTDDVGPTQGFGVGLVSL